MKNKQRLSLMTLFTIALVRAVSPTPAPAQDFGFGQIVGAMMQQAARAQRQHQYTEQQRRGRVAQGRAREHAVHAEEARAADERRQEVKRAAEEKRQEARRIDTEKKQAVQQAKLARVAPPAKELIEEASEFVKRNPNLPDLLNVADAIGSLSKSVDQGNPDLIEQLTMSLSASLRKEPAYPAFASQRAEQQRQQNARYLADAIKLAERQNSFMLSQVARDPASSTASAFSPLIKQIAGSLSSPSLEQLAAVTDRADFAIRQAGLDSQFQDAAAESSRVVPTGSGLTQISSNKADGLRPEAISAAPHDDKAGSQAAASADGSPLTLATTEKNRFLLQGDLNDVVIAYNTSNSAPHIIRNLRGDIVLDEGLVDACTMQSGPDPRVQIAATAFLKTLNPKKLEYSKEPCSEDRLLSYDVVAARRGSFLATSPQYALSLVKEIELDDFKQLSTISANDLQARGEADKVRSMQIETDIGKGAIDGFGLLKLTAQSGSICAVTSAEVEGHRRLLLEYADQLTTFLQGGAPNVITTSADGAFASAKKDQCALIYASAVDLKQLMDGFKRDGVEYAVMPFWVEPAQIDAADQTAKSEKTAEEQQALARQRRNEEQRKLAALRSADLASDKAARQQQLRSEYANVGNAEATIVSNEIKAFLSSKSGSIAAKYPDFSAWYQDHLNNQWELSTADSTLSDYGLANWRGRSLDTAFSEVKIKLKNRFLGDYEDSCFVFGQITDTEFSMNRDPFEASCDDLDAIARWKSAHGFTSRWTVE